MEIKKIVQELRQSKQAPWVQVADLIEQVQSSHTEAKLTLEFEEDGTKLQAYITVSEQRYVGGAFVRIELEICPRAEWFLDDLYREAREYFGDNSPSLDGSWLTAEAAL